MILRAFLKLKVRDNLQFKVKFKTRWSYTRQLVSSSVQTHGLRLCKKRITGMAWLPGEQLWGIFFLAPWVFSESSEWVKKDWGESLTKLPSSPPAAFERSHGSLVLGGRPLLRPRHSSLQSLFAFLSSSVINQQTQWSVAEEMQCNQIIQNQFTGEKKEGWGCYKSDEEEERQRIQSFLLTSEMWGDTDEVIEGYCAAVNLPVEANFGAFELHAVFVKCAEIIWNLFFSGMIQCTVYNLFLPSELLAKQFTLVSMLIT